MRKKIIASILFLIVFITSTIVYAALDAKAEINPSAGNVKPGDEVTFTVKVKDISSDKGINGVEGIISYDTDKFEELKSENVTKASAWEVAYNKDNGKVIAEGLTALKENTDVIKITLKVKNDNNLAGKTATISLNNVVAYNDEKVDIGTISSSVKIESESGSATPTPDDGVENTPTPTPTATAKPNGGSESTPTPSTKPNNTTAPTATAKPNSGENKNDVPITNINTNTGNSSNNKGNSSSGSSSSSSNKGTTSSSSLPKAGIGSTVTVLTVIAALLGTVSYIKLRKYREI